MKMMHVLVIDSYFDTAHVNFFSVFLVFEHNLGSKLDVAFFVSDALSPH